MPDDLVGVLTAQEDPQLVLPDGGDVTGPDFQLVGCNIYLGLRVEIVSTEQLEFQSFHAFSKYDVEELDEVHVAGAEFANHTNGHLDNGAILKMRKSQVGKMIRKTVKKPSPPPGTFC